MDSSFQSLGTVPEPISGTVTIAVCTMAIMMVYHLLNEEIVNLVEGKKQQSPVRSMKEANSPAEKADTTISIQKKNFTHSAHSEHKKPAMHVSVSEPLSVLAAQFGAIFTIPGLRAILPDAPPTGQFSFH